MEDPREVSGCGDRDRFWRRRQDLCPVAQRQGRTTRKPSDGNPPFPSTQRPRGPEVPPGDARRAGGRAGDRDWRSHIDFSKEGRPCGRIGAKSRTMRIQIDTYPCDQEAHDVDGAGS